MKTLLASLISLTIVSNSFAQDAVEVKQGQPAPYTGILLTPTKAESIKKELLDKDRLIEINESFKRSILLYKQNEEYYQGQNALLREQNVKANEVINKQQGSSTLEKVAFIGLGILATGFAIKGVQALK